MGGWVQRRGEGQRGGGRGYIFTFLYAAAVVLVIAMCKSERCVLANRPRKESSDFLSRHLTLTLKAAYSPETLLFTQPVAATLVAKKTKKVCDLFWVHVVTKMVLKRLRLAHGTNLFNCCIATTHQLMV